MGQPWLFLILASLPPSASSTQPAIHIFHGSGTLVSQGCGQRRKPFLGIQLSRVPHGSELLMCPTGAGARRALSANPAARQSASKPHTSSPCVALTLRRSAEPPEAAESPPFQHNPPSSSGSPTKSVVLPHTRHSLCLFTMLSPCPGWAPRLYTWAAVTRFPEISSNVTFQG